MKFKDLVLPGEERWVKARYYTWLERYRDKKFHAEEAEKLTYILTKNEERNRTKSWSASSAGQCKRRQEFVYLGKKGTEPTTAARNIFRNGDYMHLRYQVAGLMDGWLLDVEVPVVIENMNVKGTIDGICSDEQVIDFKSMNTNQFRALEDPKYDHKRQLHAYMRARERRHSRILYEDKNNQEIKEFTVHWDADLDAMNVSDWRDMQHDMDNHVLAPPLPINDPQCNWCPFKRDCRGVSYEEAKA